MELLNALGINYKILIAQFVNFSILFFVLWRFAYNPIMDFLEKRRLRIEEGVLNSQKALEKIAELELKEKKVLAQAKKEALQIMDMGKQNAELRAKEILAKAKEMALSEMDKERQAFAKEKEMVFAEMKDELAVLVMSAVRKIMTEKIDTSKDQLYIKKVVSK